MQWFVGVREELARAFEDLLHGAVDCRFEVRLGTVFDRTTRDPIGVITEWAGVNALVVPRDLGPHVRLHPVHPGRTEFEGATHAFFGPRSSADPLPGFDDFHVYAGHLQFASGDQAGETGPDNYDMGIAHGNSSSKGVIDRIRSAGGW